MSDLLIQATEHGVAVELHDKHFDPLIEIVRKAKSCAVRQGDPAHTMFREIEYRLVTAQRAKRKAGAA